MSDATYKSIELVGTSSESYEEATESAIERASKKMRKLRWFEVVEQRGYVEDGEVSEYQVRLRVWFHLDD